MLRADPFRIVHVGALALCLILMPWSTALLSMAQMLLVANWVAEGIVRKDRGHRWRNAFGSAPVLLFIGFLVIHFFGLIHTSSEGMPWGLDLVRILFPVLVFAVVLGGSPPLTRSELRTVLLFGAWSVISSTIVCLVLRGMYTDYRQLSAFISHIRLALMLCMSVAIFLYYLKGPIWLGIVHIAAIIWAIYFIDLLGSIQALAILIVLACAFLWRAASAQRPGARWALRSLALLPFLFLIGLTAYQLDQRYAFDPSIPAPEFSVGGESYSNSATNHQKENGELVWSRIAWSEVHRAWPLRSGIPLDSLDGRGHLLYPTLFRYLASKGSPKDSVGIMSLSEEDVRRVEAGIPNHSWGSRPRVFDRFDEVMFEIDQYLAEGRVSGHSVTMRLEFWKAGFAILQRNWAIGVGTGDTQVEFDRQYELMETRLAPEWRHRAHNQYLTWLISFGIIGTLALVICLWWPAYKMSPTRHPLFSAWLVIIAIGSLTDDTLETQAGATFFALYYSLFVFAIRHEAVNGTSSKMDTARTVRPLEAAR